MASSERKRPITITALTVRTACPASTAHAARAVRSARAVHPTRAVRSARAVRTIVAALAALGTLLFSLSACRSEPTADAHGSPQKAPNLALPTALAPSTAPPSIPSSVWPAHGQAAFIKSGDQQIQTGPNQHPAPIASVTKVMTAYLVLRDHPLAAGQDGPTITLTAADVADTDRRRALQQSVVAVAAGEELTERQALQALLLPSANNIAIVLARWDAGSVAQFVARMNTAAQSLGMADTHYTDPSGFEQETVSTAADQVRVVEKAMALPVFADIVGTARATLPVAGTVSNTDTLLGRDGFVGVKTGSDNAAGGCFAFRAVRQIGGRPTTITGVVLGQPGADQIAAGLGAAHAMVDRIADRTGD